MSKEVKRYGYGYVDDGNGNRYLGLIEKPDGNLVKHEDYKALLAERDAAQKDAERMAFIEEHPNWLRKHKKHWQCVNPFTNYEYPVFKTAREAVDSALQGEQP